MGLRMFYELIIEYDTNYPVVVVEWELSWPKKKKHCNERGRL